jgi:hypothetical protein
MTVSTDYLLSNLAYTIQGLRSGHNDTAWTFTRREIVTRIANIAIVIFAVIEAVYHFLLGAGKSILMLFKECNLMQLSSHYFSWKIIVHHFAKAFSCPFIGLAASILGVFAPSTGFHLIVFCIERNPSQGDEREIQKVSEYSEKTSPSNALSVEYPEQESMSTGQGSQLDATETCGEIQEELEHSEKTSPSNALSVEYPEQESMSTGQESQLDATETCGEIQEELEHSEKTLPSNALSVEDLEQESMSTGQGSQLDALETRGEIQKDSEHSEKTLPSNALPIEDPEQEPMSTEQESPLDAPKLPVTKKANKASKKKRTHSKKARQSDQKKRSEKSRTSIPSPQELAVQIQKESHVIDIACKLKDMSTSQLVEVIGGDLSQSSHRKQEGLSTQQISAINAIIQTHTEHMTKWLSKSYQFLQEINKLDPEVEIKKGTENWYGEWQNMERFYHTNLELLIDVFSKTIKEIKDQSPQNGKKQKNRDLDKTFRKIDEKLQYCLRVLQEQLLPISQNILSKIEPNISLKNLREAFFQEDLLFRYEELAFFSYAYLQLNSELDQMEIPGINSSVKQLLNKNLQQDPRSKPASNRQRPEEVARTFDAVFITPIQQIPRYSLHMASYPIKDKNRNDVTYAQLVKEQCSSLAKCFNETMRTFQSLSAVLKKGEKEKSNKFLKAIFGSNPSPIPTLSKATGTIVSRQLHENAP